MRCVTLGVSYFFYVDDFKECDFYFGKNMSFSSSFCGKKEYCASIQAGKREGFVRNLPSPSLFPPLF